ncbi:MAG: hypothetical protein IPM14_02085 [bacterium]|nr:hypothetical protein [bacterium]
MNISKKTISGSFWFILEVIGIFLIIQLIRFVIGNFDAFYSGLSLVLIALVLFLTAFLIARKKDKHQNNIRENSFSDLI